MEEGAEITVRVTAVGEQQTTWCHYYFDAEVDDDELVNDDAFIAGFTRFDSDSHTRSRPLSHQSREQMLETRSQRIRRPIQNRNVHPLDSADSMVWKKVQAIVAVTVSARQTSSRPVGLNGDGERDEVVDVIEPNMDGGTTRILAG